MSWDELLDTVAEAAQMRADERNSPPVACPNDGTPLKSGSSGVLYCEFDGWQYPRDRVS